MSARIIISGTETVAKARAEKLKSEGFYTKVEGPFSHSSIVVTSEVPGMPLDETYEDNDKVWLVIARA